MEQIYEKHRDEDGFLYLTYQDMEDKGGYWLGLKENAWFCIAFYPETFVVTVVKDSEELIYVWIN